MRLLLALERLASLGVILCSVNVGTWGWNEALSSFGDALPYLRLVVLSFLRLLFKFTILGIE